MSPPARIGEKAIENAKTLLSAVFMGLRTMQIHDPNNRAVENVVRTAHDAAIALYASTGGFKIQFVDQTVFLNGTRMRFDGGLFRSIRVLEAALRSKQIGGFFMSAPPSFEAVRTLLIELAREGSGGAVDPGSLSIGALGLQSFSDGSSASVEPSLLAVQSYAKLMLALREQFARVRRERAGGRTSPIRLRVVRILQDLVELIGDRPDLLLRLSTNLSGAEAEELHGINTCLLSLAMGEALGFGRRDLVDLAMAALFHHIGSEAEDQELDRRAIDASAARMFADAGVSRSSLLRAIGVAHQRRRFDGRVERRSGRPHPFARIIGVAATYSQLVGGYGTKMALRAAPLDVLQILMQDDTGRFDPDVVDLLINVLRAFPVGCHVVLDTGEHAVVTTHLGSSRWDRPVVAVKGTHPRNVDLILERGRHQHRIAATARYLGRERELPSTRPISEEMPVQDPARDSPLLDAVIAEETRATPPPSAPSDGEDMDALFKEFLAEDKKRPKIDTSYSSNKGGRE